MIHTRRFRDYALGVLITDWCIRIIFKIRIQVDRSFRFFKFLEKQNNSVQVGSNR